MAYNTNWPAIKTEYVTSKCTYKDLAVKWGVSETQIQRHSAKEGWIDERKKNEKNLADESVKKVLESQASQRAADLIRFNELADKILSKLESCVEQMPDDDVRAFRQIAATIKDVQDIKMLKSEGDIREQEVRIARLQAELDRGGDDKTVRVYISDDVEEVSE